MRSAEDDRNKERRDGRSKRTGAQAVRIAAALREDIVTGVLEAGCVLRQERLAEAFATSRMPVRDALRVLEGEGLIHLAPNRGAIVAALNAEEFRETYEMRGALETLALRLAIPDLTERQLDHAEAIHGKAQKADMIAFGALNKAFHMVLYAPSGRTRLLAQISALNDVADRYLRVAAAHLDYTARSHEEHGRLLESCRRRDAAAAQAILRSHIEDAGHGLYGELSKRLA